MNKIIFLDVDGVLNDEEEIETLVNILGKYQYSSLVNKLEGTPFDYKCCELLRKLVEETQATIVLSSTWRLNKKGINLIEHVLGMKIKDKTQYLGTIRGKEIKKYLETHKNIENYVIIDDDNDMLSEQLEHFVQIDRKVGLTKENVKQCLNILNKK